MYNTSFIEISRSALEHNLRFIGNELSPDAKLSSVVKGNAYGHGIECFVPLAEKCGIRHFSVFSAREALRVFEARTRKSKIMIMGMIDPPEIEWAIENNIEFYVFDEDRLGHAIDRASRINKKARIHLEIETGMNRTGFCVRSLKTVAETIVKNRRNLDVRGLCTHYAGAESIANYYRVNKQYQLFRRTVNKLRDLKVSPALRHTACSAAMLRYPKTQMDLVRVGILQYGFFPSREVMVTYLTKKKQKDYPLERLISWKSKIMDIKSVRAGEFVGYGTSYLANTDMKIAVIPVGYGNGFTRGLSNQGRVLIRGQRVSVVGMVNMNMMTVDITNVDGVERGDEVVIIGNQGELELSVSAFGEFSDQINYELLTRLPADIPRRVVG